MTELFTVHFTIFIDYKINLNYEFWILISLEKSTKISILTVMHLKPFKSRFKDKYVYPKNASEIVLSSLEFSMHRTLKSWIISKNNSKEKRESHIEILFVSVRYKSLVPMYLELSLNSNISHEVLNFIDWRSRIFKTYQNDLNPENSKLSYLISRKRSEISRFQQIPRILLLILK